MPRLTDLLRPLGPALLPLLPLPTLLAAQGRELEFHLGRWGNGQRAATYEARTSYPLVGILTHGLTAGAIVHDSLGRRRAFYGMGYELQAFRRRASFGPYVLVGAAIGLSTDTATQELAAHWSFGAGLEWRPFSRIALGVEARYRVEDRGPRGFWRLEGAREGFSGAVGLAIGLGKGEGGRGKGGSGSDVRLPPEPPANITGSAADVVRTALDALGAPYKWGGTAENGFDCSGLIQYAYGQYGIRLPRTSRDQAQSGFEVPPVVEALAPGDILLFSERPGGGVTHVGMYVGEQKFIHSSNTGVKLSRLDPHDPDGAWWLPRWVGVRRVIQ